MRPRGTATATALAAIVALVVGSSRALGQATAPGAPGDAVETSRPAAPLHSAKGDEAFLEASWPDRVRTRDGAVGVVRDLPCARWDFDRMFFGALRPRDADRADAQALLDALAGGAPATLESVEFEGRNAFTVRLLEGDAGGPVRRTPGASTFVAVTARPTPDGRLSLQRTWFVLYDPIASEPAEAAPKARGVALFMPGIFGTPEGVAESLVRALRRRGWCVLRLLAQPSRFTEAVEFRVDPAHPESGAVTIADTLGQRAAEVAYAVELAMARVDSVRPELGKLPHVVIGFSGGAITTPVVVARDPRRFAAAILVAGGADYWLVNAHSTYADMISSIRTRWLGRAPTEEERAALARAYRAVASLDSFHAAGAMRGMPSLHILASADSAVPRALGDLLARRMGASAEVWSRPGEHLPLFMALPKDYTAMLDGLDARARGGPGEPGAEPAPVPRRTLQPAGAP